MKWRDHESSIEIHPPAEFNFEECLVFLNRSDQEVLHQIIDGYLFKMIKVDEESVIVKIGSFQPILRVEFPLRTPSKRMRERVAAYIWEWFDLDQDLSRFYEVAKGDNVLESFPRRYYGLRIMCIPDLFETLTWAIIGQQINLTFAYTLKKRFVEQFGESLTFEGDTYWLYPTYERVAKLKVEDLRSLQFTGRKAEYVIGVAKVMKEGLLTKELLMQIKDYHQLQKSLMAIRGIGAWTADYVMMRCLHQPFAFPIADVGLHNALKLQLGLERKPTQDEIRDIQLNWEGWQAYAAFYLWRSLL